MRNTTWIALTAIILGLGFDQLFFETNRLGVNLLLAEILFLGASYVLAKLTKHHLPERAHVAAVFALLYGATFAIWTSSMGASIAWFGFLVSNLLFVAFAIGHEAHFRHPWDIFVTGAINPIGHLFGRLHFVRELKPHAMTARQQSIGLGLVISIPLLFIFINLFAAADPIFGQYTQDFSVWLEKFLDLPKLVQHIVTIGFFTGLFGLFFAASYWQRFEIQKRLAVTASRFTVESQVVLSVLFVLFAMFIAVQFSALFGGSAMLARINMTYAQYARTGFDQLIVSSILVATVILILRAIHGRAVSQRLRILHVLLIGETFILLVSALYRVTLYCQTYGFTPDRLFAYWMIILVGILLALLKHSVWYQGDEAALMRRALLVMGVMGLIFVGMAPDALSVRLNIARANREQKPIADFYLFRRLSEEAVGPISAAYASPLGIKDMPTDLISGYPDPTTFKWFCNDTVIHGYLDGNGLEYVPNDNDYWVDSWQEWNLSRSQARSICQAAQ